MELSSNMLKLPKKIHEISFEIKLIFQNLMLIHLSLNISQFRHLVIKISSNFCIALLLLAYKYNISIRILLMLYSFTTIKRFKLSNFYFANVLRVLFNTTHFLLRREMSTKETISFTSRCNPTVIPDS